MKKLSKRILAMLMISMVGFTTTEKSFASDNLSLIINGKSVSTSPILKNGRTLVPIRVIGEELGSKVDYNAQTNQVNVIKNGVNIKLTINQKNPLVNGVVKPLDVPAIVVSGRTYVPVRFISESFGIGVNYNGNTNQVFVGDNNGYVPPVSNNSSNVYSSFDMWEDAMDIKFGDNWDDAYEYSLISKYGHTYLNSNYGKDWDDRLEYALYKQVGGKLPSSIPNDLPSGLAPTNPVPPTNTGSLSFGQWENQMEWKFGDDWDDSIENAIERKYGENHMEYKYGDDWDDRLEYALYQYYGGKIPTSLIKDIPSTLKPIR